MSFKIAVVSPVYNDWQSFQSLVDELNTVSVKDGFEIEHIVAVNDGSSESYEGSKFEGNTPVSIVNLNNNVGHQRAISIGLSYMDDRFKDVDCFVVMDSDGEDRPQDIVKILQHINKTDKKAIVFAKREKRSEGLMFKLFYRVYKASFYWLTNQKLEFGNFSAIPRNLLSRVTAVPELWNHYSGAIMKSKIPYQSVGTDRGRRYHGESKMNFANLVLHGLSSISIYLDVVSVRLLFVSFFFTIITVIALCVVVALTLFTDLTIPGWPSIVGLSLLNILAIVILTTFLILLFQLNQKTTIKLSPKNYYKDFILSVIQIHS
ncbi:glycosyltransferase [uncultured Psychroserpens sp.]|uniref:glycosyltransferase n=1 Tax=uncultured Psychroserpens sp. TaxID=255436 RepID=UPI0026218B10|nr:glycosyltransferase [uncultured Psychroserpens sp.]